MAKRGSELARAPDATSSTARTAGSTPGATRVLGVRPDDARPERVVAQSILSGVPVEIETDPTTCGA